MPFHHIGICNVIDDFTTFKEALKSRVDIVDIVGEYVELKRRGSNHTGLCPFHTEKTPSFSVNQAGQFYHCFGCGKGGDVFGFLMDITGMSFMEALEHLAERYGMEVPKMRAVEGSSKDRKDIVVAANIAAAEYFHKTLSSEEGKTGMDYLTGRGLTQESIRAFRLGYAPDDPTKLIEFAKTKGINRQALEEAGVLIPSRYGGQPYGRFGGRVIFPIIDQVKRVIGFGGRLMEGEGAKYVNSPETLIYHKSHVLFGIHQAKDAVKLSRRAIVVEGYMDVISLHQAGIQNVIAASGTAFTIEQGKMIARMAKEATLLFDGDPAGLSAAARGADNLLATELVINVVVLPDGHDPDSFVREKGAPALNALLGSPEDIWEFKLRVFSGEAPTVQDRIRLAGEVAESISRIPDDMKRDAFIREMSAKVQVDINSMLKAVQGRLRRRARQRDTGAAATSKALPGTEDERTLIGYIIAFPDLARRFLEEAGTKPFNTPVIASIAEELFNRLVEGLDVTPSALIGALKDRQAQEIVAGVAIKPGEEGNASKYIEDHIRLYKIREARQEIAEISYRIDHEADPKKKRPLIDERTSVFARIASLEKNGKIKH